MGWVAEKLGLTLNKMENKKLIALTGGIGCGKSTALQIISELGYKTLSSDQIVGELYEKKEIRALLKPLFPTAVFGEEYVLDKKEIARIAFTDKDKHSELTNLITPMVMAEIVKRTAFDQVCFVEVPLLFECDYAEFFDGVIVLTRPIDQRIQSVITRSNMTKEQVLERINNQFDYENADLSAYTVILNDGNVEKLKENIKTVINSL